MFAFDQTRQANGTWKGIRELKSVFSFAKMPVAGVHQYEPGDLDEFARLVTGPRIARRRMEPNIRLVTFEAGETRISNVDAEFAELDRHKVKAPLSSRGAPWGFREPLHGRGMPSAMIPVSL